MTSEELAIETPWRRDPEELCARLLSWARRVVEESAAVEDVRPPTGGGMSSDTVVFTMHSRVLDGRFVARLAPLPSSYPVFRAYDLEAQKRCMELVREHAGVPAPEVVWFETDESFLGAPFLVMRHIEGKVAPDLPPYTMGGWVAEATVEERGRIEEEACRILARVHQIRACDVDLSFLERPGSATTRLGRQLADQRHYYEWAREGRRVPLVERALAWLEDDRPDGSEDVLLWGDSRIGNILWRGTEPVGVLDWEMAAVGPREVDVAWMIFMHDFLQDLAERYGMAGIPGFMSERVVVEHYERFSGVRLAPLRWYRVFAALRFAVISMRLSRRSIAFGMIEEPEDPDSLIIFRDLFASILADVGA